LRNKINLIKAIKLVVERGEELEKLQIRFDFAFGMLGFGKIVFGATVTGGSGQRHWQAQAAVGLAILG